MTDVRHFLNGRQCSQSREFIYRLSVAWQNVSCNQPAPPGFFLGHGMSSPKPAGIGSV